MYEGNVYETINLLFFIKNNWLGIPVADPKWGSGPGAVEFLESEVCFDAPFTHTLCFVVRVENKVHIINIV